jgi:hypothetical protein
VFRWYDLSVSGTSTSTFNPGYSEPVTLQNSAIRDNSLSDTSVTPMTLPRLFTRKGCG